MKYSYNLVMKLFLKHLPEILKMLNVTTPADIENCVSSSFYAMDCINWLPYKTDDLSFLQNSSQEKQILLNNTRVEIGRIEHGAVHTVCLNFITKPRNVLFNKVYIPVKWLFELEFGKPKKENEVSPYRKYETRFLV